MQLIELSTRDITKVKWIRYRRRNPLPPPKFVSVNSLYIFSKKGVFVLRGQYFIRYFLKRIGIRYKDVFNKGEKNEIILNAIKQVDVSFELVYRKDKTGYYLVTNINGVGYVKRKKYRTL